MEAKFGPISNSLDETIFDRKNEKNPKFNIV